MPLGGFDLEDSLLRDPDAFVPSRVSPANKVLPDIETMATVKKIYKDLTADVVLGAKVVDVEGPMFKRVPIRLHLGEKPSPYGSIQLPQEGDVVILRLIQNRTQPIIDRTVFIRAGVNENRAFRDKVLGFLDSVKDWIWFHISGTKWKVKANGDFYARTSAGFEISTAGSTLNIEVGTSKVSIETNKVAVEVGAGKATIQNTQVVAELGQSKVTLSPTSAKIESGAFIEITAAGVNINGHLQVT